MTDTSTAIESRSLAIGRWVNLVMAAAGVAAAHLSRSAVAGSLFGIAVFAAVTGAAAPRGNDPIVIAHRGASGHRPEHTLAAYRLAIEQGADFIEPDLVATRDGVLVARHENEISETTDVGDHPEFADRRAAKLIDGAEVTGWFTEDLTLAELKTLRARERLPALRTTDYDGRFEIPTLEEILDLLAEVNARSDRERRLVGIYPETKHPSHFAGIGLPLEEPLVEALHRHGWDAPDHPVFIQSFEVANLEKLRRMTRLPLVQLIASTGQPPDLARRGDTRTYADLVTPEGLAEIATYARGIGVNKGLVLSLDGAGHLSAPTPLVGEAHRAGLLVHVWTLRAENRYLPPALWEGGGPHDIGDMRREVQLFLEAGVDGFFTDHPDLGVAARDAVIGSRR